ncbi:hypothetical protein ACU4GI_39800 [Cupriavidus basilensis]
MRTLFLYAPLYSAWTIIYRHAFKLFKRGEATATPAAVGDEWFTELGSQLRATHGLRWRYRQPWLLLTGDDAAIARLLPELAEQGWLITPDAVLLWSKTNKEGWPDADWLKALYRLRRRRPVDAVILTTDSAADLQAQRRGTHPDGMRLARIAELLRWSAPVYLLDVAEARTVAHGLMPVISCELPRQADADAIDGALRTLRDQLAQRVVAQLMEGNRDRYMGELSQRLDTRGKALANWIAGLGGGNGGASPWPASSLRRIHGLLLARRTCRAASTCRSGTIWAKPPAASRDSALAGTPSRCLPSWA